MIYQTIGLFDAPVPYEYYPCFIKRNILVLTLFPVYQHYYSLQCTITLNND